MKRESLMYRLIPTPFGELGLMTMTRPGEPRSSVIRVLLPAKGPKMEPLIRKVFPGARRGGDDQVDSLAKKIRSFVEGKPVVFFLDGLDLSLCGDFQRLVLMQDFQVPRGQVTTYGRIAEKIGRPGAARAVGTALARNPFPLVIPCHRVVRAGGHLGGFGGGLEMKKALLEMEGVRFNKTGQVAPGCFSA